MVATIKDEGCMHNPFFLDHSCTGSYHLVLATNRNPVCYRLPLDSWAWTCRQYVSQEYCTPLQPVLNEASILGNGSHRQYPLDSSLSHHPAEIFMFQTRPERPRCLHLCNRCTVQQNRAG